MDGKKSKDSRGWSEMNLDSKEKDLLDHWYTRISSGLFDEKDTFAFLILIRPYTERNSVLRDLTDFIAHRRRDRGAMLEFIQRYAPEASDTDTLEPVDPVARVKTAIVNSEPLCSNEAFRASLNGVLRCLNLSPLTSERSNDVMFCVMALLQNAQLRDAHDDVQGSLLIGFDGEVVVLFAIRDDGANDSAMIPILRVPNRYLKYNQVESRQFMATPNAYLTVFNLNGQLRATSE